MPGMVAHVNLLMTCLHPLLSVRGSSPSVPGAIGDKWPACGIVGRKFFLTSHPDLVIKPPPSPCFHWRCLFLRCCYDWLAIVTAGLAGVGRGMVTGLVIGIVSGPAAGVLLTRSVADSSTEVLTFLGLVTVFKSCMLCAYMPLFCVCTLYDQVQLVQVLYQAFVAISLSYHISVLLCHYIFISIFFCNIVVQALIQWHLSHTC